MLSKDTTTSFKRGGGEKTMKQKRTFLEFLKGDNRGISLSELPSLTMTLILVGGLALGGFVTWQALADSTTNTGATSFLNNITTMMGNIGSQLPTVGTIIGVGLLISVVVVAFVVARRRGAF